MRISPVLDLCLMARFLYYTHLLSENYDVPRAA